MSHRTGTRFTCAQGLLHVPCAHDNPSRSPGKPSRQLRALGHLPRAGWEGSTCHQEDVLRVTVSLLIPTLRTQRSPNGAVGLKGTPCSPQRRAQQQPALAGPPPLPAWGNPTAGRHSGAGKPRPTQGQRGPSEGFGQFPQQREQLGWE